ncbi:apical membrane antigen 1 protein, partial [Cystoisospora suis]
DGGGSPDTQQPNPGGSGPAESEEEGPNVVAIAGGVIGGLLLLILVGAGAGYYFQHKGPEASEAVANEVQGGRPVHSPSDVAANTSQSYWGEELLTDAKP